MTPFSFRLVQSVVNEPGIYSSVSASSFPVPNDSLFVVEHISGYFVLGADDVVDMIFATDDTGQEVYLPTHMT
jgi:hypothetical protein